MKIVLLIILAVLFIGIYTALIAAVKYQACKQCILFEKCRKKVENGEPNECDDFNNKWQHPHNMSDMTLWN